MNTGSFFTIGTTHLVCEDYALHGPNYVILSDGCSNGGGPRIHTDWGSRILCKAAEQHLHCLPNFDMFMNRTISTAKTQATSYPNLDPRCLTATLLVAYVKDDQIHVFMSGDGVIGGLLHRNGGKIRHQREISFPQNAPYYMKYELDPADKARYLADFGSKYMCHTAEGWASYVTSDEELDINDKPYYSASFDVKDFQFFFIASDGVQSFYKPSTAKTSKQNEKIPVMFVLDTLLDFRNFDNNFVERQSQWVFKTKREGSFGKADWHNGDDVSLGVIHCG